MKNLMMTKEELNLLPTEIQEDAKRVLKAFDQVNITFYYGKYHVSTGISILGKYPEDHNFIGVLHAKDVFTTEERIINYAESFHDFSPLYKGKRDYSIWKTVGYDWSAKFKIEDGKLAIK